MRSMTGFGRSAGLVGARFAVTIVARSVNHRYLELSVKLPESLWELESVIRQVAGEHFSRGKVDVAVRAQRSSDTPSAVRINRKLAESLVPQVRELGEELGLEPLSTGDLLRLPEFVQSDSPDELLQEEAASDMRILAGEAFAQLVEMRKTEGQGLAEDVQARLLRIRELRDEVAAAREGLARELVDSFKIRVTELASAAGTSLDDDRLAQEIVLMAEKSDVAEELTRLEIHLDQMRAAMTDERVSGKKLDFLVQEILREINTIGQKSRASKLRTIVVELKTEADRIREQVQNVE